MSTEPVRWVEQRFRVETECHGWRLDLFLCKKIKRLSRARIQRVIWGDCTVDETPGRPNLRVRTGQVVWFRWPAPDEPEVPREISVVHQDPWFYLIDKPAGLPVHPTARYHHATLTSVLRERFPGEPLQMAHRLDRETSGLMLIARSFEAGSAFKQLFAKRKIRKRYLAIVHGTVPWDEQTVDLPIGPAQGQVRIRMDIMPVENGGLPATSQFRVVARAAQHTLLECLPLTGRQHQIRVHANQLGHPLLGDKLYPDEGVFLRWLDDPDETPLEFPRHALHAAGLHFVHPSSGEPLDFSIPLAPDLAAYWYKQPQGST